MHLNGSPSRTSPMPCPDLGLKTEDSISAAERCRWARIRPIMAAALATAYQLPPEEPDDSREGKMSFLEHLDELRKRIIRSCLAAGVGMVIAFVFINRIVAFVLAPMRRALPPGSCIIYTKPTEAFSLYINIARAIAWHLPHRSLRHLPGLAIHRARAIRE